MFQKQHVQPAIANGLRPGPYSFDESRGPEALQDIVLRHQICYEVWPEWSGCGGRARRIGYSVTLCGVNDRVECVRGHHVPGCPHCALTYDEIRKIAEWIMADCRFQIEPFDRAWRIAPSQRCSRNEIIVNMKILHSHNVDGPVNESHQRRLNDLRVTLKKLGVREGVWQTAKVAAH